MSEATILYLEPQRIADWDDRMLDSGNPLTPKLHAMRLANQIFSLGNALSVTDFCILSSIGLLWPEFSKEIKQTFSPIKCDFEATEENIENLRYKAVSEQDRAAFGRIERFERIIKLKEIDDERNKVRELLEQVTSEFDAFKWLHFVANDSKSLNESLQDRIRDTVSSFPNLEKDAKTLFPELF